MPLLTLEQRADGKDNAYLIRHHGSNDGWNFSITTQPAQSPDFNILDLAFFHSLKVRVAQIKLRANTMRVLRRRRVLSNHDGAAAGAPGCGHS